MEKKNNKKRFLLIVLLLLVFVSAGVYTYARYLTEFSAKGTADIATWAVKLTKSDGVTEITSDATLELAVAQNDNVVEGKIAPASSATGTFVLDPTGSEVAIDYQIEIDDTNLVDGMTISSVTAQVGAGQASALNETALDSGIYTGSLTLSEVTANNKVTIVVTVTWENNEANNTTDTAKGVAGGTLEIPIKVTAKQHITE